MRNKISLDIGAIYCLLTYLVRFALCDRVSIASSNTNVVFAVKN